MELSGCAFCQKPKAQYACGICKHLICKKCAERIHEGSFSFRNEISEELTHAAYCGPCFEEKVSHQLRAYEQVMAKAKAVSVYYTHQGKETRLIKRSEKPLRVEGCADKNETLLRLAFFAAESDFNTLVDVKISGEKVRNGGYQTTIWHGVAFPVQRDTTLGSR